MIRISEEEYQKLLQLDFLRLLSRTVTPEKTPQGEFVYYSFYRLCWGVHNILLQKEIHDGETFYYANERFYRERITK